MIQVLINLVTNTMGLKGNIVSGVVYTAKRSNKMLGNSITCQVIYCS